ncbi:MAG: glycosyltransferase family 2 protein [Alphaproteobacteria bacterium]|nr:glycosyltransferase family 2 protein [Alphaproteobacteria bacterium]
MNNKKVSIIVPVYNAENYLKQCLDSIVNQTYKNTEIICINDASTDNSLSILKDYGKNDKRIKILSGEHIGAGKARNLGIKNCSGDYLLFLDCDDFFEFNMVEEMLNKIINENSDIVICENTIFDDATGKDTSNGNSLSKYLSASPINPKNYSAELFTMTSACAWNKLFKASLVKENAVFFEDLTSCNDVTFTYTMLALAKSISIIDKQLVHYRTNQKNNISANRGDKAINGIYAVNTLERNLKNYNLWDTFSKTFYHKSRGVFLNELTHCNEQQKQIVTEKAKENLSQELFDVFISSLEQSNKRTWKVKLFNIIPLIKVIVKGKKTTAKFLGIQLLKIEKTSCKIKFCFCGIPIFTASTKK